MPALSATPFVHMVIAPLFSEECDALDLTHVLSAVDFDGELVILLPRVPRPEIVKREISLQAPGLRIRFLANAGH